MQYAGRRADTLLAFEDAAQFFQTALDAMEQRTQPDDAERCRVLLLLGETQRKSNDFSGALSTLAEAAKAAKRLGLPEILANAALAYQQSSWRSGLLNPDPPPTQLLEEALDEVPETKPALRARLSGALGRALLYANAEAEAEGRALVAEAIGMARSRRSGGAGSQYLSPVQLFLGAGEHRGATSQRNRDGCRSPAVGQPRDRTRGARLAAASVSGAGQDYWR